MIVAIGMDPGPTPGLVHLMYSECKLLQVGVVQCSANEALDVLGMWLQRVNGKAEVYFGVEAFVDRVKGRTSAAGNRTRDMVGSSLVLAQAHGAYGIQRSAVTVKAWATDARLRDAGLLSATKGMTHARDGARHALYTACKDARMPDPLSRKAR